MFVKNKLILRQRRATALRAGTAGLAVGLFAAFGGVHAAPIGGATALPVSAQSVAANAGVDPAKQLPGGVSISKLDFKRGDGGSGKLILRFSGDGAVPDMRTQGSSVVIDVGNANLAPALQRPLNVTDFATPVQRIDVNQVGTGSRIVLATQGTFEPMAYQTGRDYVVEIVPRAAAAPADRAVGAATTTAAGAQQVAGDATRMYTGRPVTFDFQSIPVRTALKIIADEAHLNIVASDTVQGEMTLSLDNVPWDQALDIVLQAKGLDKRRNGNVVWVAPQAEIASSEQAKADARIAIEERAEMVTEYIPVNYANAEDIAKLLTEESKGGGGGGGAGGGQSRGFLSTRGSISFDRRTNTLLMIDIPQRVQTVKNLVSQLDRPVDQVVIEARIVIANESFARELGAKFGISGSNSGSRDANGQLVGRDRFFSGGLDSNGANINSVANAQNQYTEALRTFNEAYATWVSGGKQGPQPIAPNRIVPGITRGLNVNLPVTNAAGALALSILNAGYLLDIELSALQQEQRGEVISNPRVVTSNQREAVISQGREIGYITVTGGQNANVPTVQFKDALLELKVTPTITNDGRVFLAMAMKKDEIADYTTIAGLGSVPNLAKRAINTAVLVEDGQTVVIGGVYEFNDRNDVTKVPFLGDLPIIGNLFKKKGRFKNKAELLIFVTPKVLRVAQRN
ncbi:type IV pilus secretin PilQ [Luteimonas aquatica]|uniref:type IV pilus secretin PilQ n=1 Tax=Luteimonas aquatica TaxID=450364 RepID=UPI001F5A0ACC|nr:type IV pilus secretin PilQ family protein [Luteimonas aquatica]